MLPFIFNETKIILMQSPVGYVTDLKKLLVTIPISEMREIYQTYQRKTPESLTAQFTDRLSRDDAIKRQKERRQISVELFPPGKFV